MATLNNFQMLLATVKAASDVQKRDQERLLAEHRKQEALKRKQQEEREAKEREQEKKIRMRMLEEEQKRKEKEMRREAEVKAQIAARERREEEQRQALLYGPNKSAKSGNTGPTKYPSKDTSAARKRRSDSDSDDSPGTGVLTREEIRAKKQEIQMRQMFAPRKQHSSRGYSKSGNRLPGGAVNIVVNPNGEQGQGTVTGVGKTVKERLANGPNTLTLLRPVARDRRTVDEAQQDIRLKLGKATPKILSGEDAKAFDDWFGDLKSKKKSKSPPPPAPVPTPKKVAPVAPRPSSAKPSAPVARKSSAVRSDSYDKYGPTTSSSQSKNGKPSKSSMSTLQRTNSQTATAKSQGKRPRTTGRSESPPPKRQRRRDEYDEYDDDDDDDEDVPRSHKSGLAMDVSTEIWKIMGKNRSKYVNQDVYSDDDDMEADALALEREEKRSARIAKQEELQALEEERRHDEEKRRRKREKELALRGR